jgi:hypothetical protein
VKHKFTMILCSRISNERKHIELRRDMLVKFGVLIFAISIQSSGQAQKENVVEVATGYRV